MTLFQQAVEDAIIFLKLKADEIGIPETQIRAGSWAMVAKTPFLEVYAYPEFDTVYENADDIEKLNVELHIAGKANSVQINSVFDTIAKVSTVKDLLKEKYQGISFKIVMGGIQADSVVIVLSFQIILEG